MEASADPFGLLVDGLLEVFVALAEQLCRPRVLLLLHGLRHATKSTSTGGRYRAWHNGSHLQASQGARADLPGRRLRLNQSGEICRIGV